MSHGDPSNQKCSKNSNNKLQSITTVPREEEGWYLEVQLLNWLYTGRGSMQIWELSDKTEGLIKALKFISFKVQWPLVSSTRTKYLPDPANSPDSQPPSLVASDPPVSSCAIHRGNEPHSPLPGQLSTGWRPAGCLKESPSWGQWCTPLIRALRRLR